MSGGGLAELFGGWMKWKLFFFYNICKTTQIILGPHTPNISNTSFWYSRVQILAIKPSTDNNKTENYSRVVSGMRLWYPSITALAFVYDPGWSVVLNLHFIHIVRSPPPAFFCLSPAKYKPKSRSRKLMVARALSAPQIFIKFGNVHFQKIVN